MPYIGQGLQQGRRQLHTFTATASQTTFSASYTPGFVDVYQNGILLAPGDYTATNGNSIVLAVGAAVSDEITIIAQHMFSLADVVSASTGGTFSGDVTMAGNLTVQGTTITVDTNTAQTLAMGDADKIKLGDDGDLEIYHDGSNSYIDDTGTGSIFIRSGTTYIQNAAGNKTAFATNSGAEQTLYHNNSPKFSTSATGVSVTGTVAATAYTGDGSALTGIEAAAGGGTDHAFLETDNTINSNYSISSNRNAMTVGPVTVASGATITVPSGQRWIIM